MVFDDLDRNGDVSGCEPAWGFMAAGVKFSMIYLFADSECPCVGQWKWIFPDPVNIVDLVGNFDFLRLWRPSVYPTG